ncbi:MAG TPA: hypothetical protein VGR02_01820, partial [Thermoanaerobaculia bacterium]|nr:hypothetical protein [Thermoanaerobaculia bacterium]
MTSLSWEELRLRDVVARTGTPALLVSERRLRANIRGLRGGLPPSTILRYCTKTNPELGILRIVREEGLDVLASHEAEVRLALAAGFAPEQIAFQRPVLDERELDAVLAAGVRRVHAFRAADLDLLSGTDARVSLRIALARSGMPILSGASKRLGFAPAAVRRRDGITIDALNTYIGTQQESAEAYRPAIRELVRLGKMMQIEELNLGGGIPSNSLRKLTPSRLLTRRRAD